MHLVDTYCMSPTSGPTSGMTQLHLFSSPLSCISTYEHVFSCRFTHTSVERNVFIPSLQHTVVSTDRIDADVFQPMIVQSDATYDVDSDSMVCVTPAVRVAINMTVSLYHHNQSRMLYMSHPPLKYSYRETTTQVVVADNIWCEQCAAQPPAGCVQDCAGVWQGNATVDQCGVVRTDAGVSCDVSFMTRAWRRTV